MIEAKLYRTLVSSLMTEKSVRLGEKHNQFTFKVLNSASKEEIKDAVQKIFSVKVQSVKTLNIAGKHKRFKQSVGKRSDWKKAYVSLAEGHDINIANFE